ncbi:MAG TPA: hypothetical protein VGL94_04530, partial [Ktedonobacteraceae bacterium]
MEKKSDDLVPTTVAMSTLKKTVDIFYNSISRENLRSFLAKAFVLLRSHLQLFIIGIISECIYLFYLLNIFPLSRYFQINTFMGHITGYTPINFIIAITFFIILFIIFCMAWWQTERFQDRATLWIILGFGSIFAITNIFVYPLTAGDLFLYVARSLIMVQHHANPMVTPPDQFANTDPLMKLAKGFMTLPSPYGPLAILIQAL